jgi:hypothetical protein
VSRNEEIIKAYEAWDPDTESATELAEKLGISKARLYQVLQAKGVTPKTRIGVGAGIRATDRTPGYDGALMSEMAEQALGFLLNEVVELRRELAEYRERYGPL